jgi:site-specific recombinase XerD
MLNKQLQQVEQHPLLILAGGGSRSRRSRLQRFCTWQLATSDPWYLPDLISWRDQLINEEKLSPKTARAYLSTIRSAYRQLLRSNEVRQWFYDGLDQDMSPERKLALLTEFVTRLKNAIDPDNAPVSIVTIQDEDDSDHLWLTPSQAAALVQVPGLDTLKGLRDTALIALILCTGIRAAEAVALDIADLRTHLAGKLALRVKSGKGVKQRLIPYGAQDWGLILTEAWLDTAGLIDGPVFIGLRRGDNFYLDDDGQPQRLAVNGVGTILREYPLAIEGRLQAAQPHDLRRTYTRRLYLVGTDLVAIQQNLGHDHQDTTLSYIGKLDAEQRAPDDAYGTVWLQPMWETLSHRQKTSTITVEEMQLPDTVTTKGEIGGYIFKIWIHDIKPQIWRRFQIPAGITFRQLHDIIQIVMGWENYHLYRFSVDYHGFADEPMGAEDRYSDEIIDNYLSQLDTEFFYEYDFGDSWGHILKVEKIVSNVVSMPECLAGNRACPPEDCGGPWLYAEFLQSRKKKAGRVSPKWQDHIGKYWDSEKFDLKEINEELNSSWGKD